MAENSKLLNEINFLRPLLIIGVIVGHCFAIYSGAWENNIGVSEVETYKYLGMLFIHLGPFVMISGYLFAYKKEKYMASSFWQFFWNKFKRIFLPGVFFSILYVIFIQHNIFTVPWRDTSIIFSILGGVGHLWFLPMLFCNFVLIKILHPVIDRAPAMSFLASIVLMIGISVLKIDFLSKVFHYLPFIILGYILFGRTEKISKCAYGFLALWLICYAAMILVQKNIIKIPMIGTVASFSACLAFLLLFLRFAQNHVPSAFIMNLNKESYGAYIFQQFIIILLLYNTHIHIYVPTIWLPWLIAVISIFCSFLCSKLLLKTKVGRFLIG